jgi:hypothetical protein
LPTPPRPSTLLAELRAIPRSVVVRETVLVVLVLAAGMIPVVLGGPHPAGAVAGAVGGVALLLARSRWPLATMLGTVALYSLPSPCCAPRSTAGRRTRPLWRFRLIVTATVVLGLAISLLVEERAELTTIVLVVGAASTVFVVGIPALAGVLLGGRRPMVRLLRERNEYLERRYRRPGPRGGVAASARQITDQQLRGTADRTTRGSARERLTLRSRDRGLTRSMVTRSATSERATMEQVPGVFVSVDGPCGRRCEHHC